MCIRDRHHFDLHRDEMKQFFTSEYGVYISTIQTDKLKCSAHSPEKLNLLLKDCTSNANERGSELTQKFLEAVKWPRDDACSLLLRISEADYHEGLQFCTTEMDKRLTGYDKNAHIYLFI